MSLEASNDSRPCQTAIATVDAQPLFQCDMQVEIDLAEVRPIEVDWERTRADSWEA